MKTSTVISISMISCAICAHANSAHAALGEPVASIEVDRRAVHGSSVAVNSSGDSYSIHRFSRQGTEIREYVRPDGIVFAVTWRGVTQPDLSVLFGNYYDEYESALKEQSKIQRRSRASRVTETPRLRIDRSGHMRDVRGRAYVRDLLPSHIRIEDIAP